MPDATTLLKFRRLLLANDLTKALFDEINAHLAEQGLPIRVITARDGRLARAVNDMTSVSPSRPKPTSRHALAPSVAKPRPQKRRARRQPISTQGEIGRRRRGTDRPMKPMNSPVSLCSTAQLRQPRSANGAHLVPTLARVCDAGKAAGRASGRRVPGRDLLLSHAADGNQ